MTFPNLLLEHALDTIGSDDGSGAFPRIASGFHTISPVALTLGARYK